MLGKNKKSNLYFIYIVRNKINIISNRKSKENFVFINIKLKYTIYDLDSKLVLLKILDRK